MSEKNSFDMLDLLVIIVKRKVFLSLVLILSLAISYGAIYYFVDEKFEANSVIVPSEQSSMGGLSSMMKGLSGGSFSFGNSAVKEQIELYNTIIFSRSTLETILDTFKLMKLHQAESREKALKSLKESIITKNNEDVSFEIVVRESTPKLAADITNFIVTHLNKTVINLNVRKSRENREFIQKRYEEVVDKLDKAQDSLVKFQKKSGVIEPEAQLSANVRLIIDLESELAAREIELEVMRNQLGAQSPQLEPLMTSVEKIKDRLKKLKAGKDGSGLTLSVKNMPEDISGYFTHFRNVEINQKLLEFVLPMYEQSKFEEQKEIPVLQIIDTAVPPEKKAWPPRTLFAAVISLASTLLALIFVVMAENSSLMNSEKMLFIRKNLFSIRLRQ